jgi:hypothetical protein
MKLPTDYTKLNAKGKAEVRQQYIELQDNKCYYCQEPLNKAAAQRVRNYPINLRLFPPGFLKYPVHLQHNHDTNMTEGAVHAYCNGVMWQYEGK